MPKSNKKPRTWRWVSCYGDLYAPIRSIRIHEEIERPSLINADGYTSKRCYSDDYHEVCGKGFKNITGVSIKPGTCVKVDFKCRIIPTPKKKKVGKK